MEQLDIKSLYEDELKEKMVSLGEKTVQGKTAVSVASSESGGKL